MMIDLNAQHAVHPSRRGNPKENHERARQAVEATAAHLKNKTWSGTVAEFVQTSARVSQVGGISRETLRRYPEFWEAYKRVGGKHPHPVVVREKLRLRNREVLDHTRLEIPTLRTDRARRVKQLYASDATRLDLCLLIEALERRCARQQEQSRPIREMDTEHRATIASWRN